MTSYHRTTELLWGLDSKEHWLHKSVAWKPQVLLGLGASSHLSLGRNQSRRSIINKMASLWNSIELLFIGFSWSSRPILDSSVNALPGSSIEYSGIVLDEPLIEVWNLFSLFAITSELFLPKMASLWNSIELWFRGFSWSSRPISDSSVKTLPGSSIESSGIVLDEPLIEVWK